MTDPELHNEWIRYGRLKEIFGIEPYENWGSNSRFVIDEKRVVEIGVCVKFTGEYHFVIATYKYDRWHDGRIFRDICKGMKYYEADTFEQAVDVFHQWFRKIDDDEQLELF